MKTVLRWILRELTKSILSIYRPKVIAVTGSVGKTSTKQVIGALVARIDPTVRVAPGSFNTDWGVPMTVIGGQYPGNSIRKWFALLYRGIKLVLWHTSDYPKTLVMELGADHPGDIGRLSKLVRPSVGVVTAIAPVHLEGMGTIENIAKEKLRLLSALPSDGIAVVSSEVDAKWDPAKHTKAKLMTAGDEGADVYATDISFRTHSHGSPYGRGTLFKLHWKGSAVPCFLPEVVGWAAVESSCLGAAVGLSLGINLIDVSEGLRAVLWPLGRMHLVDGIRKTVIIDDSYNASPKAMTQALEVIETLAREEGRGTWVVLGDMAELGPETESAHRMMGRLIAAKSPTTLVTVGPNARWFASDAIASGYPPERVRRTGDAWEAGRLVQENLREGEMVLVKGSQIMRMERVVKELMARPLEASKLLVRQEWWWK